MNKEKCKYCEVPLVRQRNKMWFDDMIGINFLDSQVYLMHTKNSGWEMIMDLGDNNIERMSVNYCPKCGKRLKDE